MKNLAAIKKVGYIQAFKAVSVGLVMAYIIMALLAGPLWLFEVDYAPAILFAVVMTYIAGYFFGKISGLCISKGRGLSIFIGILSGFLIVWTATCAGGLIGFVQEGLSGHDEISKLLYDYLYKPLIIVTIFSCFPVLCIGIWFGLSVRKKINSLNI